MGFMFESLRRFCFSRILLDEQITISTGSHWDDDFLRWDISDLDKTILCLSISSFGVADIDLSRADLITQLEIAQGTVIVYDIGKLLARLIVAEVILIKIYPQNLLIFLVRGWLLQSSDDL